MGRGDGECWRCRDPHPAGGRVVWVDIAHDRGATLYRPCCVTCATDWAGDVSQLPTAPCDACNRPVTYTDGHGKSSGVRTRCNACSFGCANTIRDDRPPPFATHECQNCGQLFLATAKRKFCGQDCRTLARTGHRHPTPEDIAALLQHLGIDPTDHLIREAATHLPTTEDTR